MTPPLSVCAVVRGRAAGLSEWLALVAPHAAEIVLIDAGCAAAPLAAAAGSDPRIRVFRPPPGGRRSPGAYVDGLASHRHIIRLDAHERLLPSFWDNLPAYLHRLQEGPWNAIELPVWRTTASNLHELEAAAGAHDAGVSFRLEAEPRKVLWNWRSEEAPVVGYRAADVLFRLAEPVDVRLRVGISILVHEAADVVKDQIANVQRWFRDPVIVLHVNHGFAHSGGFAVDEFERIPGVLVNPEHIDTGWGQSSVPLAMLSNYRHLAANESFDAFVLNASNDLYLRRGAEARIRRFDAGCSLRPLPLDDGTLTHAARNDRGLQGLRAHLGGAMAYASGHEGTFYRRELFDEMEPLLERFMRADLRPYLGFGDADGDYAKEEFYFATAAGALAGSIGDPLIYRDWVSVPSIPLDDVRRVLQERWDELPIPQGQDFYGVKRVARVLDDPVRIFIRSLEPGAAFSGGSFGFAVARASKRVGGYDYARMCLEGSEEYRAGHPPALAEMEELEGLSLCVSDPHRGVRELASARTQSPVHVGRLRAFGVACNTLGRDEEAVGALLQARVAAPDDPFTLMCLARALRDAGRAVEAEEIAAEGVDLHPADADLLMELGNALLQQGRREEALPHYRRMLRLPDLGRRHLTQAVAAHVGARRYLEIGVSHGVHLAGLSVADKLGVDPVAANGLLRAQQAAGRLRYLAVESDALFGEHAEALGEEPLDVVYIDGLHTWEQSRRDLDNSLRRLRDGGVLIVDDCSPTNPAMASPTMDPNLPGWSGQWTGDVWKTMLEVRGLRTDLAGCTFRVEFGIGIVVRGEHSSMAIAPPERPLAELDYEDLQANRQSWLGLRPAEELLDVLDQLVPPP